MSRPAVVTITVNRNMLCQLLESALARAEQLDESGEDDKTVEFIHECARHVDAAIHAAGVESCLGTDSGD